MASFTDIIPQFTPYIQQLPVEAMVQVGMEKQKRYDEGIQKIQSQIDQIGGMDIYSTKHKAYLQSKLNELGNNLSMVAAGDFSNFQLVNSVGGMIGQVVKDPIVKNAYESTQLIRKQQGYMEEAKRKGKSSPENEWWFSNEVSRWDSDPDLARKFTGEYIEYTDVGKKLTDIASKIKDMEKSVDIPYQRNADGSYRLDKNGNPIVDDAMLRIKVKGTPAEKILNTFYSTLDENDKRQLMITGNYHYRNASKTTFQNDIISTYDTQKKALADNLSKLAVELKTNDNLTSSQRAQIETAITNGVDKLNSGFFEKEAAAKIDEIGKVSNLEDFKYRTYTQKYLTGLAQDLSNQSYTEEILSNPYAQMNMEKKKLEFQVNRAKVEDAQFWAGFGLRQKQYDLDVLKFKTERADKDAEAAAKLPIASYGGLGTNVAPPTVSELENSITSLNVSAGKLRDQYGALLFGNLPADQQLKSLKKLEDDYRANPFSIKDPNQIEYLQSIGVLNDEKSRRENLLLSTQKIMAPYQTKVTDMFKGVAGYNNSAGEEVYSAEDLYKVRSMLSDYIKLDPYALAAGVDGSKLDRQGFLKAVPAKLKPLAGELLAVYDAQPKGRYPSQEELQRKASITTRQQTLWNRSGEIVATYKPKISDTYIQAQTVASQYLAKRMPEYQTTFGTLNMSDKITEQRVNELIGNATKYYDQFGSLDVNNPNDFKPSKATEIQGQKGAKFVIEKNFDGTGKLILFGENNSKQIIPMSASDLNAYFPSMAKSSFMTKVKYDILSSPELTTNTMGRGKPVGSAITGYDIAGLQSSKYAPLTRVDIEGSSNNDGSESDRFAVRMYVYDKGVWKDAYLNQQGFVGPAGVEEILKAIGPLTVQDVLSQK
jgi:hypothetical protein